MPNAGAQRRAEAVTFAAYFGSSRPPAEVVARYELALAGEAASTGDRFDDWLIGFARRNRIFTSLADAYARVARPYGQLRRHLTLMLALLETHGTTHAAYDRARPSNTAVAWVAIGATAVGWAVRTVVAALICGPTHLVMSFAAPARS